MSFSKPLKAILLLDDTSRTKMRASFYEVVSYGVIVISKLRELSVEMLDKTRTLVVLEDGIKSSGMYSDLVLYRESFGLDLIYVGQDPVLLSMMEPVASCFTMESTLLDYPRLASILFKDDVSIESYSTNPVSMDHVAMARRMIGSPEYDSDVKKLATGFIATYDMLDRTQRSIDSHKETLSDSLVELGSLRSRLEMIEEAYTRLTSSIMESNHSLAQYETILSNDIYEKINLSRYPNRPRIIYLKEYEEISHVNSFLSTLFEVFRLQGKSSVKVLRLFDSSGSRKIQVLPSYYKRIQHSFTRRDVISSDFIIKVGGYKEVLDLLLSNPAGLDVLIIMDSKDHLDTVISGKTLDLAMCRNPRNIPVFGLDEKTTIVSSGSSEMCWDHYENYDTFDDSEKFLFLSSRPVIRNIIEMERLLHRQVIK